MSAADRGARAAWAAALAELERGLDDVERAVRDDDWSDPPAIRVVVPETPVPRALVPRAWQLMARLDELGEQVTAELRATGSALADLDVRRSAARNYRKSAATASAADQGDD